MTLCTCGIIRRFDCLAALSEIALQRLSRVCLLFRVQLHHSTTSWTPEQSRSSSQLHCISGSMRSILSAFRKPLKQANAADGKLRIGRQASRESVTRNLIFTRVSVSLTAVLLRILAVCDHCDLSSPARIRRYIPDMIHIRSGDYDFRFGPICTGFRKKTMHLYCNPYCAQRLRAVTDTHSP